VAAEPPSPPEAARELFGPSLPRAEVYAGLLVTAGVERGLIGPGEAVRVWARHLINSGVVADLLPAPQGRARDGGQVVDLGSGAGLPGIVLAILRPDLHFTLVEPMARRTVFLAECAEELELGNVEICRARAEELAGEMRAEVVTSRAVARLDRLAGLSSGLSRPGGLVLAIKGDSAAAELEQARSALSRLGATDAEVVVAGRELMRRGLIERGATVVRFRTAVAAGSAEQSSGRAGSEAKVSPRRGRKGRRI
jgi:16S rRNA (guanine527-N7)-methyltransferase